MNLDYDTLTTITERLNTLLTSPNTELKRHRFQQLYNTYPDELDFILSLSLELPKAPYFQVSKNSLLTYDFQKDFGYFVYLVMKEVKPSDLQFYINGLPYSVAKLFLIIGGKHLIRSLGYNYVIEQIHYYYKLGEIMSYLILPDILTRKDLDYQAISRNKVEDLEFPIELYKVPVSMTQGDINYLIKDRDGYKSNIRSQVVRTKFKTDYLLQYGVLGYTYKIKGKKRLAFKPLYFNTDAKSVLDLYSRILEMWAIK